MLRSYVLRLVPAALAEGRLAGTVQVVDTGHTVPFASLDELLVALTPRPRDGSDPPRTTADRDLRVLDLDAGRERVQVAGTQDR